VPGGREGRTVADDGEDFDRGPDSEAGHGGRDETRSQRGNHALKSALFLSAFASLSDPASRAYYDRKRTQGKRHNAALICLARRRVDVLFAMLRDHTPYQAPNAQPAPLWTPGGLTAAIETPPGPPCVLGFQLGAR